MTKGCSCPGSYTLSKSTDTNSYDARRTPTVAPGQLRTSPTAKGRRTSTSGIASRQRDLRAAVQRQPAEGRLAARSSSSRRRPATREHRHEHHTFTGVTSRPAGSHRALPAIPDADPRPIGPVSYSGSTAARVCDPRIAAGAGRARRRRCSRCPYTPSGVAPFRQPADATRSSARASATLTCRSSRTSTLAGSARVQFRVEVFNLFNQANLGQPGRIATVGSTSFGVITNTRFPTGDSGSARQVQFAAKFLF